MTLIRGLHHVTATVSDAQEDLDFYTRLLGMRLVKKTVNFDNHHVFHFYYGNERGEPSTIMTTFPYAGQGVRHGVKGAGQIVVTSFSVPRGSLDAWKQRLSKHWVAASDEPPQFGEEAIVFSDPSGLGIRLVANASDDRTPWVTPDVPLEQAIRGVDSVTAVVRDRALSVRFLTEVLGYQVVDEDAVRSRVAARGNAPGHRLDIVGAENADPAINGLGTVHHVAMAVADAGDQTYMQRELRRLGFQVTDVRDRQYFTSIYFREPGGVLYEIATVPPGFTVDEEVGSLGRDLKLPPWEEPFRAEIEKGLPKIKGERGERGEKGE